MKADAIVKRLVEETNNYRTLVAVDVYGLDEGWHAEGKVTINWSLEMDARAWGIKEMTPVILSIEGSAEMTLMADTEDQTRELPLTWRAGDPAFTVDTDFKGGTSILPKTVEVDLKRKRMIVQF